MRIKLFTHNDLDGVSCTAILKYLCNQRENWRLDAVHNTYTDIDTHVQEFIKSKKCKNYDAIYITDIPVSEETAEMLEELMHGKVILIDHHKTSEPLIKYKWVIVKTMLDGRLTCGTELLYKLLSSENILTDADTEGSVLKNFVELVRLWDTWDWKESNVGYLAKNLNTLFKYLGIKEYPKWFIDRVSIQFLDIISATDSAKYNNKFENVFSTEDRLIIDVLSKKEDSYVKRAISSNMTIKKIWDYNVALITAEDHISSIGNTALEKFPDVDIAAVVNFNTMTCSLRARTEDDIDVSEIARLYLGGGGHEKAAAFSINQNLKEDFFNRMINQPDNQNTCETNKPKRFKNRLSSLYF